MILHNPHNETTVDLAERHVATAGVAQWFGYGHLPEHLQRVSALFQHLAADLLAELEDTPELTVALRELLAAKDAAVRCAVLKQRAAETG